MTLDRLRVLLNIILFSKQVCRLPKLRFTLAYKMYYFTLV